MRPSIAKNILACFKQQKSNLKYLPIKSENNLILIIEIRLVTKSLSNSYKRTFKESGLFYFQTDTKNSETKNLCVVEVQQSFR